MKTEITNRPMMRLLAETRLADRPRIEMPERFRWCALCDAPARVAGAVVFNRRRICAKCSRQFSRLTEAK